MINLIIIEKFENIYIPMYKKIFKIVIESKIHSSLYLESLMTKYYFNKGFRVNLYYVNETC